jgi:hypothetical protein
MDIAFGLLAWSPFPAPFQGQAKGGVKMPLPAWALSLDWRGRVAALFHGMLSWAPDSSKTTQEPGPPCSPECCRKGQIEHRPSAWAAAFVRLPRGWLGVTVSPLVLLVTLLVSPRLTRATLPALREWRASKSGLLFSRPGIPPPATSITHHNETGSSRRRGAAVF